MALKVFPDVVFHCFVSEHPMVRHPFGQAMYQSLESTRLQLDQIVENPLIPSSFLKEC